MKDFPNKEVGIKTIKMKKNPHWIPQSRVGICLEICPVCGKNIEEDAVGSLNEFGIRLLYYPYIVARDARWYTLCSVCHYKYDNTSKLYLAHLMFDADRAGLDRVQVNMLKLQTNRQRLRNMEDKRKRLLTAPY